MSWLRPIDRLTLWWLDRKAADERPPRDVACAECGRMVPPGEGFWFARWRLAACSEDCSFAVQSDRF